MISLYYKIPAVYGLYAHGGEYGDAMKITRILGGKVLTTVSQVLQRRKSKVSVNHILFARRSVFIVLKLSLC